ncbi:MULTISPECIES: helix-turn-helix domain-containing protein [Providencia]|uniref:Helix-turn-helix transcriptional regulator n=3 Tax=Providencia rettgeri TaxID=587 RepID=A0A1B8SSV1_PRORE|nr:MULTISPECIES: helix-turn-helix transcriptional regulator [Providencia]AWS51893.1 XRE family transcriptional regulator [Providencia rettgeri]EJD6047246.1 helix-turn-helix transcriptional regulator [Providencia rettgeri]EJD6474644.1 helix-turn-helix transcriptional regulator [Providencia rettgeri]EKT57079.1 fimbrial operon regulator [Providencia rettgeri Dmel1]ELH9582860.1 helix-turn-helix transcriptional regulator [Providencia rettgeri]
MDRAILNSKVNILIGNYLRQKRIENDLTGEDISKLLHVSQQQVSRYENGVNTISFSLILMFLIQLNISVESFFVSLLKELESEGEIIDLGLNLYSNSLPNRKQYLYL